MTKQQQFEILNATKLDENGEIILHENDETIQAVIATLILSISLYR